MPKPVTLNIVQKPFGPGYLWIAAFQGTEHTGPFGHGDTPTQAINELVDVAETLIGESA